MTLRQVKRPQAIMAVLTRMVNAQVEWDGVGVLNFLSWFAEARDRFIIAQRDMLESNSAFRQLMPYTALARRNADGQVEYLTYQRTAKGGEPKLDDKVSIGWAGHIDLSDVVWNKQTSVVSPLSTFIKAMLRELDEEIKIVHADTKKPAIFLDVLHSKMGSLLINQNTDPEIFHTGIVTILEVKDGFEFDVNEEELSFIGWKTRDQLIEAYGATKQLEPWTFSILDYEHTFSTKTEFRFQAQLDALDALGKLNYLIEELTGIALTPGSEHYELVISLLGGYRHQDVDSNLFQASYAIPAKPQHKPEITVNVPARVLGDSAALAEWLQRAGFDYSKLPPADATTELPADHVDPEKGIYAGLEYKARMEMLPQQKASLKQWLVTNQRVDLDYDEATVNKILDTVLNRLKRRELLIQLGSANPEEASAAIREAMRSEDEGAYRRFLPYVQNLVFSEVNTEDPTIVNHAKQAIQGGRLVGLSGRFSDYKLQRGDVCELRLGTPEKFVFLGTAMLPSIVLKGEESSELHHYEMVSPRPYRRDVMPTVKVDDVQVVVINYGDEPAWGRDTDPLAIIYVDAISFVRHPD